MVDIFPGLGEETIPFGFFGNLASFFAIITILAIFGVILKGLSLWRAGRRGQKWWFISILIVNSLGILPLIYLFIHRNKTEKSK